MNKYIFLYFFLSTTFCIAQLKDGLLLKIKNSGVSKSTVQDLTFLSIRHYKSQPDSGLYYAKKALKMSEELDYLDGEIASKSSIALADYRSGNDLAAADRIYELLRNKQLGPYAKKTGFYALHGIYYPQYELDSCLKYTRAILRISKEIDPPYKQYIFYNKLGVDYLKKGYTDLAIKEMLASLRIANTIPDNDFDTYNITMNTAIAYGYFKDYEQALHHQAIANELANKMENPASIIFSSLTMAASLLELERYDEAKERLGKFDRHLEKYPDIAKNFLVTYHMNKANYNEYTGNYKDVVLDYKKILTLSKARDDIHGMMIFHLDLAHFYIDQNEIVNAQNQIDKAAKIQLKIKDMLSEKDIYQLQAKVDSLKGDHESYIKNLWAYLRLKDSIASENTANTIAQLNIAYETERKDNEIALLNTENSVKEANKAKMRLVQIGLGILALLLLVLAVVYYKGYKNKKKSLAIIQHKNNENKLLVKETHHRVKNNLQIISSLLTAQTSKFPDDKKVMKVVKESQNRIKSLAIIHEELYQNNKITSVNARYYFNRLLENVRISYDSPAKNITIDKKLQDVELKMSMAVPLGLILNELLTNSYKYAFENRKQGRILVTFEKTENAYSLFIADNGNGFPEVQEDKYSFGLKLVEGLTEQFDGYFSRTGDNGSQFKITLHDVYQNIAS